MKLEIWSMIIGIRGMVDDDFPKIGKDFQKWSDLDDCLPKLDLEIELFRRRNVWIASFVILAGLLKGDKELRLSYLSILTPSHFDPESLARYLFEKLNEYLQKHEQVPEAELEKWIPQYSLDVWGSRPSGRDLFSGQIKLRQILSFNPTEEQTNRAIELRKEKKEKYGF